MPFAHQISLGYSASRCGECSELAWAKPTKLAALIAANKTFLCRVCQEQRGWNPPWPAARRLTDEELTELEVETARNVLAYAYDQQPPPSAPLSTPFPLPVMDKPLSLKALRERLVYQLDVTKTKKKDFYQAAGISQPTLYGFLKNAKCRNGTRFKIEAQMKKRDWLLEAKPQAPEKVAVTIEEVNKAPGFSSSPLGSSTFTSAERYRVIISVMTHIVPEEKAVAILDKLFPSQK